MKSPAFDYRFFGYIPIPGFYYIHTQGTAIQYMIFEYNQYLSILYRHELRPWE